MTKQNFRWSHSLKRGLTIMESHVKTTADGYYTASVYGSLGFYLFFVLTVNLLRGFTIPIQFQHTYFCCLFYR